MATKHIHIYVHDSANFKEADHPRSDNGQFGSGGSSKKSEAKATKTTTKTSEGAAAGAPVKRISHVAPVLKTLGFTKTPRYADPMTHGYRVSMGKKLSDQEKTALKNKVKKEHNLEVTFRERTGYGPAADLTDIMIPFAK